MSTHEGTATVWQSGRLAPQAGARHIELTPEQGLGAALLGLSALVLAVYVTVLERDVDRNALQRAAERSRAVAEAQCESEQPADQRGRCIALFNGDQVAVKAPVEAPPGNALYEQENAARAMTVSLVAGAQR
jgi:hypothetical protein